VFLSGDMGACLPLFGAVSGTYMPLWEGSNYPEGAKVLPPPRYIGEIGFLNDTPAPVGILDAHGVQILAPGDLYYDKSWGWGGKQLRD
jgi:hypothetical protein